MQLKEYMYHNHLTIEELAKMIGIDRGTLSRYLRGKKPISERSAYLISKATNGHVDTNNLTHKEKS